MPLEDAAHIGQLNPAWPLGSDGRNTTDDHIRMTKKAIQDTFVNVDGPITPTHTELNYVDGVTSSIQTQLNSKINLDDPAVAAFIKAQGFQFASIVTMAVNTTLTASHVGKLGLVSGAVGAVQLTLPLTSAVSSGAPIRLLNVTSQVVTVATQGTNAFVVLPSNNPASIKLQPGDSLEVVANTATGGWHVTGGTAAMAYAGSASVVATANGYYQKYPNGILKQWGTATGTGASITFPMPFIASPSSLQVTPTSASGPIAGKVFGAEAVDVSATGFSPYTFSITTSGTVTATPEAHLCSWVALGLWQ